MVDELGIDILLPEITEINKPFYDALADRKLVANKCSDCGHTYLPPALYCAKCLSENIEWVQLSGKGTIYSFVEYHRPYHEIFKDKIPYVVAIIETEEGARLISNIVDYDIETLKVGQSVEAMFTDGVGENPIVLFK